MIDYSIVFLYHLSSSKALLYARSSFGAPVMISRQVFRVFQHRYSILRNRSIEYLWFQVTPTAILPHFTKLLQKLFCYLMEWCYIQILNWS